VRERRRRTTHSIRELLLSITPNTVPGKPLAPAAAEGGAPSERPAGEPRLPVAEAERVIDPACAATIDLAKALKATYPGRVYYFCSVSDRDEFVRDPSAYLKKRGK
jgi:YHS domain-containing protein